MPKTMLVGKVTATGWNIIKLINEPLVSGGNFCTRYEVEREGRTCFLKAMDLASARTLEELQKQIEEYLFERNVLNLCKNKNMTRVVTPIDAGEIEVENFQPPGNKVYYIIFEKAEEGNLRQFHLESTEKQWRSVFKALHHVAIGLQQLHAAKFAHHDIKPSNVLSFTSEDFKVGDLGRVVDEANSSPWAPLAFPGDNRYRPIECDFGEKLDSFESRLLCDMYLFGSLIYHMIEEIQLTYRLRAEIRKINGRILSSSYQEALPYVETAFVKVMDEFEDTLISKFGAEIASDIRGVVSQLCNPILEKRGNPRTLNSIQKLQLHPYVSKMDLIDKKLYRDGIS